MPTYRSSLQWTFSAKIGILKKFFDHTDPLTVGRYQIIPITLLTFGNELSIRFRQFSRPSRCRQPAEFNMASIFLGGKNCPE